MIRLALENSQDCEPLDVIICDQDEDCSEDIISDTDLECEEPDLAFSQTDSRHSNDPHDEVSRNETNVIKCVTPLPIESGEHEIKKQVSPTVTDVDYLKTQGNPITLITFLFQYGSARLKYLAVSRFIYQFYATAMISLALPYTKEVYDWDAIDVWPIVIIGLSGAIVSNLMVKRLEATFGRANMLIWGGYAMIAAAVGSIASTPSYWIFLGARVFMIPFYFTLQAVINSLIGEVSLPNIKGRIFGAIDAGVYLTMVFAYVIPSCVFALGVSDITPIYAPTAGYFVVLAVSVAYVFVCKKVLSLPRIINDEKGNFVENLDATEKELDNPDSLKLEKEIKK
eukprot:UN31192